MEWPIINSFDSRQKFFSSRRGLLSSQRGLLSSRRELLNSRCELKNKSYSLSFMMVAFIEKADKELNNPVVEDFAG